MSLQDQLNLLVTYQRYESYLGYTAVAGIALITYDYLLTLGDEIEYIWKERWTLGKILFLLNRYVIPVDLAIQVTVYVSPLVTPQFCLKWFYADTTFSFIQIAIVQIILLLRTVALWERNRIVVFIVSFFYFASLVSLLVYVIINCIAITAIPNPLSFMVGCIYNEGNTNLSKGVFAPPLAFETVVFGLTLLRAISHKRRQLISKGRLLSIMYRDGILYFAVVFAMTLFNLLSFLTMPLQLGSLMLLIYRALLSIMVSKLSLNVREALLKQRDVPATSAGSVSITVSRTHANSKTQSEWLKLEPVVKRKSTPGALDIDNEQRESQLRLPSKAMPE